MPQTVHIKPPFEPPVAALGTRAKPLTEVLPPNGIFYLRQRGKIMESMSVQEFAKSPQVALSMLSKTGNTVLTKNGKPSAFIIKTDNLSQKKMQDIFQYVEYIQTMADIHEMSKKNGNSKMNLKQINELIKDARKA